MAADLQAASDLYSPVTGEVLETNQGLVEEPGKVRKGRPCASQSCITRKCSSTMALHDAGAAHARNIQHTVD